MYRQCNRAYGEDFRERLFLSSSAALIGGAGLFDVIHVVVFTYGFSPHMGSDSCGFATPFACDRSAKIEHSNGVCLFWTVRYTPSSRKSIASLMS